MGNNQNLAASIEEAWRGLSAHWQDETSWAFYQQYIAKMTETAESLAQSSAMLRGDVEEFSEKLALMEQELT